MPEGFIGTLRAVRVRERRHGLPHDMHLIGAVRFRHL